MQTPEHRRSRTALAALIATLGVTACSDSTGPGNRTLRSPDIAVGAGRARTDVVVDSDGAIQAIAVVLSATAIQDLPTTLPTTEFVVPLPSDAPPSVFNHIGINWNPQGHPPPLVYTHPHFDVHYYMISTQERDAMTPANPEFGPKSARSPAAAAIPPGYIGDPQGIPRMGTHWTNGSSHEFHGQAFTRTMVYGFYDGKMVFIEPMIALSYLQTRQTEQMALSVPASYPKPGRYPTSYRIAWDASTQEYRIELVDFVSRP